MNKSFVISLPSAIDNPDLLKLGELRFTVESGGYVSVKNAQNFTEKILTPGVTYSSGSSAGQSSFDGDAGTTYAPTVSGNCEISLIPKYGLERFFGVGPTQSGRCGLNLSDIKYCVNMKELSVGGAIYGDIANLKRMTKLEYLAIVDKNIYGDLSDLVESDQLKALVLSSASASWKIPAITGDISNLSKVKQSLVVLQLPLIRTINGDISVFSGDFSNIRDVDLEQCTGIIGDIGSFANHSNLQNLKMYMTGASGRLGDLLVGTPALKYASFPPTVEFTAADAAIADARMSANGGSMTSYGHYFAGGTLVESYSA